MRFPWDKVRDLAVDVAIAVVGALLVDRVKPAPSQPATVPTPPPRPRAPTPRFEDRADAYITARGHAGIDERFRTQPAPGANDAPSASKWLQTPGQPAGANTPASTIAPLPGSALRGSVPPDPDPTEPEPPSAPFGPRDLQ